MKRFVLLLCLIGGSMLNAQNPEGLFLRIGVNTAYPKWNHFELVVQEYNELRPWLEVKPEMGNYLGGWNIAYGVASERFWADMDFMSNRNAMRYRGIDSTGVEHKGTFSLIDRSLSLSGGIKVINSSAFRFGLFAGLSFHPVVIKHAENKEYAQRFVAFLVMPILLAATSPSPIDTKMFMAGKLGASIQIGGNAGVCIEPYYMLPFWKTDFTSTRNKLNPNTISAYTSDKFKGSMSHWGIRFMFYLGYSG